MTRRVLRVAGKDLAGLAFAATHRGWRLYSKVVLGPQLGALGRGTVVRAPLLIANPGSITIGAGGFIREGVRLEAIDRAGHAPARLAIGDRVNIEQNVHITAADRTVIGDDVCVAANVVITGAAHPAGRPGDGNRVRHVATGPSSIEIGDRVFIGANAVVMPNVSIGANSIVGAGAVVTKDVPADVVVAGVPAQVVRRLDA